MSCQDTSGSGKRHGCWTNEAHSPSVALDLFQGESPCASQRGTWRTSRCRETSKGNLPLPVQRPASGEHEKELSEGEASPVICAPITSHLALQSRLMPQVVFQQAECQFNGTITNDKFCMSRMGRLHLTWWRLPLRARIPVTTQTGYPTDVNEMECCHQEGTHEETEVQHPASHERDCRCATTVGSSLPVSYSMEQRVPEGVSSRAHSTGEQQ